MLEETNNIFNIESSLRFIWTPFLEIVKRAYFIAAPGCYNCPIDPTQLIIEACDYNTNTLEENN